MFNEELNKARQINEGPVRKAQILEIRDWLKNNGMTGAADTMWSHAERKNQTDLSFCWRAVFTSVDHDD